MMWVERMKMTSVPPRYPQRLRNAMQETAGVFGKLQIHNSLLP
jgi:hypothetical protein